MPVWRVHPAICSNETAGQIGPTFNSSFWKAIPKYSPSKAKLNIPLLKF